MEERLNKSGAFAQAGALVAAVAASACCWLPLVLAAFGLSGGALAVKLGAARTVLLPATFPLLGLGFYFAYRRPRATRDDERSADDEACCASPDTTVREADCCQSDNRSGWSLRRTSRLTLWAATALTLAFAFFPNYVGLLGGGNSSASTHAGTEEVQWSLAIEGMTCKGCEVNVESALGKVAGVMTVKAEHESGGAEVVAAPGVNKSDLRGAVEAVGYAVSSIEIGQEPSEVDNE